jgi:hypothetical protein
MPDVGFGGTAVNSFTDQFAATDGIGLPGGRACSDGANRAGITALYAYSSGTIALILGSAATGYFGGTLGGTGYVGTNLWIVSGGSATFTIQSQTISTFHFLRSSNGTGASRDSYDNPAWSGVIGGAYRYIQPPLAPTVISVVSNSDGDQATITLNTGTPVDDGGSGLTGWRVQRATNSAFTTGVATVNSTGITVMTGLTPGADYYYRAVARNALTDAAGVLGGAWSSTILLTQTDPVGLGRRFKSSTGIWDVNDGKRYNASTGTWQPLDALRYNYGPGTWGPLGH